MKTIIRDQNQRNLEPSGNDGDFNVVDIVGPSLSIVEVVREDSRDLSELPRLPLCYSTDRRGCKWHCTFCGGDMKDHSWSSFESREEGVASTRLQPAHCTLHGLLDKLAQDFFPGLKISLNTEQSHLSDNIRFVFEEVDKFATRMSTTWIDVHEQKPLEVTFVVPDGYDGFSTTSAAWNDPREQKHKEASFCGLSIDQQLEGLNTWIRDCEKNHQLCKTNNDLAIPAKRVLDLASAATGTVHLVEASNLKGRYAALSHCWGDPERHPLKTSRVMLEDHMSGISVLSLPRSFRDLIRACLYLKIQYAWIDCLCIVQDDETEWLAEAEKMADIYEQSYLTISASRALNSQHGFLFDFQDDTINYKVVAEVFWGTKMSEYRTFRVTSQINHDSSKSSSSPLNSRAWCLQEWYLPTRLVEFCVHDLRFLCLQNAETRFGPTNDEGIHNRIVFRGFGKNGEDLFRSIWEEVRKDYFGRHLTKQLDLLPAMAGLAKQFEGLIPNNKYLAGLWSRSLAEDLSWTVLDFDSATLSIEGVPSWSWASVTAPRGYIYHELRETFAELVESHCTGFARPIEAPASLTLKGFLTPLFMRVDYCLQDPSQQNRPDITLWMNEDAALTASIEEVEEAGRPSQTTSYFVLDMLIGPSSHDHEATDRTNSSGPYRVSSSVRASEVQQRCKICAERGYVSPVELLLLTRAKASLTALVLAPVLSNTLRSGAEHVQDRPKVYQRLGLLEVNCIRQDPVLETADGGWFPAEEFWETDDPSAQKTVTII